MNMKNGFPSTYFLSTLTFEYSTTSTTTVRVKVTNIGRSQQSNIMQMLTVNYCKYIIIN